MTLLRLCALLAATALAWAPAAQAKHDRPDPVYVSLEKKASVLTSSLAGKVIKERLRRFDFKASNFTARCRGGKKVKTCTYKFVDALSGAILDVPYCGSTTGTRVRLVDRGRKLKVGATPTNPC